MKREELRKVSVKSENHQDNYTGYFHSWGQEIGTYDRTDGKRELITIAIIEKEDGSIVTELPDSIKFIS